VEKLVWHPPPGAAVAEAEDEAQWSGQAGVVAGSDLTAGVTRKHGQTITDDRLVAPRCCAALRYHRRGLLGLAPWTTEEHQRRTAGHQSHADGRDGGDTPPTVLPVCGSEDKLPGVVGVDELPGVVGVSTILKFSHSPTTLESAGVMGIKNSM
jgi:hypothetical protein